MSRERLIWIGLAAVLMLALLVSAVNGAQQSAWMEGYTFGRLAASVGEGAAVAPILPYGMGYAQRGPGVGGILFLLLGFGALFFVGSRIFRCAMWRAWAAQNYGAAQNPDAAQNPGAMPPPWMHHRHGGCGERQAATEQTPGAEG
jgi:hypothetical protein